MEKENEKTIFEKAAEVVDLLKSLHWKISFAESCTGGLAAAKLIDVDGASSAIDSSFVTYSERDKQRIVGVPGLVIDTFGVVSEQVADAMARGAAKRSMADIGVGITGYAGPEGGDENAPVGTVCFALFYNDTTTFATQHFTGMDRNQVRENGVNFVYDFLIRELRNYKNGLGEKNNLLVVVDMQNDFIDGALGSEEAKSIVDNVADKINSWGGDIVYTMDTHSRDYMDTVEGKKLPVPHCILGSDGWSLNSKIESAIEVKGFKDWFKKITFGSVDLGKFIMESDYNHIEFVGLCTDICVVSNAMLAKAFAPDATIVVDASCCAGVTPESHKNALEAMKLCHIDIINE